MGLEFWVEPKKRECGVFDRNDPQNGVILMIVYDTKKLFPDTNGHPIAAVDTSRNIVTTNVDPDNELLLRECVLRVLRDYDLPSLRHYKRPQSKDAEASGISSEYGF